MGLPGRFFDLVRSSSADDSEPGHLGCEPVSFKICFTDEGSYCTGRAIRNLEDGTAVRPTRMELEPMRFWTVEHLLRVLTIGTVAMGLTGAVHAAQPVDFNRDIRPI